MNGLSVSVSRRHVRRAVFAGAVVFAVASSISRSTPAHAQDTPDTLARQLPAVPSTTPAIPPGSERPQSSTFRGEPFRGKTFGESLKDGPGNDLALRTDTSGADVPIPAPIDTPSTTVAGDTAAPEPAQQSSDLAETGVISLDALLTGLALLAVGTGLLLGIEPVSEN